jgi:hypothetical protein
MEKTASATEAGPDRKPLVSIQLEQELDLIQKTWETRVFVKLYVAARTSGLLAAVSDRDWKTLCTLATFMNKDGRCFPSQAEIARALKINRTTANERIRSLAEFRFEGKPVLLVQRVPAAHGRFGRNDYTILPITHLKIFDGADEKV